MTATPKTLQPPAGEIVVLRAVLFSTMLMPPPGCVHAVYVAEGNAASTRTLWLMVEAPLMAVKRLVLGREDLTSGATPSGVPHAELNGVRSTTYDSFWKFVVRGLKASPG